MAGSQLMKTGRLNLNKNFLENYKYILPERLIAKTPAVPRDNSRLLVYNSKKTEVSDRKFFHLGEYLSPKDLLVINSSKVFPARLFGKRITGLPADATPVRDKVATSGGHQALQAGGKIEVLLLEKIGKFWNTLTGGKISVGGKIFFDKNFSAEVVEKNGKETKLKFNISGKNFWLRVEKIGKMPIPPYIRNLPLSERKLRDEYQTVYAKKVGSVAAPTAGLHFTKKLISDLMRQGINFAEIDLHVGLGTFLPVTEENLSKNKLHYENFSVSKKTIEKILETKKNGGRIIAVGTTTVRALESSAEKILSNKNSDIHSKTEIFIQPGFEFKIVDGLITNFHLPKSSLMMLVAAFLQFKGEKDGQKNC